jgi:polar amino acid transport system substrate-binding protein
VGKAVKERQISTTIPNFLAEVRGMIFFLRKGVPIDGAARLPRLPVVSQPMKRGITRSRLQHDPRRIRTGPRAGPIGITFGADFRAFHSCLRSRKNLYLVRPTKLLSKYESQMGHFRQTIALQPWRAAGFLRVVALVVSGVLGLCTTAQAADKPLLLASANLPPIVNADGTGYLNRIFDEMFARIDQAYSIQIAPGRRGLDGASSGLFDGDAARVEEVSNKFPDLMMLPEPVIPTVFAGQMLTDGSAIRTLADFSAYRVGYIRGWKIAETLFADHRDAIAVRNAEVLMRMLANHRIDVAFMTIAPARHLAKSQGIAPPFATDFRVQRDLFLFLNQRHEGLVPPLTAALRAMKADGTYDAILAGYLPEGR